MKDLAKSYDTMASVGTHTFRNYMTFRTWPLSALFQWWWRHNGGGEVEGMNLPDTRQIKDAVGVPAICTGGFQTASVVRSAIERGDCDAISIARSLIANNDLLKQWEAGNDRPKEPCTYCNKCLVNAIENPLACYEESRFKTRGEMFAQVMSVFEPAPFSDR